ncbi:hypothetical protein [Erythrobacter sp.]|uniref:hypothetical protein n=1 Tax=Erythrobacter sp. TaxID=1042 RepID=UPI0025E62BB3|nr:hypothetical protein [Erythrobacter sp.]
MAQWTIIGKESEQTSGGTAKSFSVLLNTDDLIWTAFGTHLSTYLSVKEGKFTFQLSGELGLKLLSSTGKWVATFNQLLANSPIGATGTGQTELKQIEWKLDSK